MQYLERDAKDIQCNIDKIAQWALYVVSFGPGGHNTYNNITCNFDCFPLILIWLVATSKSCSMCRHMTSHVLSDNLLKMMSKYARGSTCRELLVHVHQKCVLLLFMKILELGVMPQAQGS